jgi:hypothetical protein
MPHAQASRPTLRQFHQAGQRGMQVVSSFKLPQQPAKSLLFKVAIRRKRFAEAALSHQYEAHGIATSSARMQP